MSGDNYGCLRQYPSSSVNPNSARSYPSPGNMLNAGGYPNPSGGYMNPGNVPNAGEYPNPSGSYMNPGNVPNGGRYPNSSAGYMNTGNVPNAGGYSNPNVGYMNPGNLPNAGGYPSPGNMPNGGGYPNPFGSYMNSGSVPNGGGYANSSGDCLNPVNVPNGGGYPNPSTGYPSPANVPDAGAGLRGVPEISTTNYLFDDPDMKLQVSPSAPSQSEMQKTPHYEQLTFKQEIMKPPSMPEWKPKEQDRAAEMANLPSLSEEDVRDAVVQYATEKCCYGTNPAKNMKFMDITMMSAFHYKLETFTEKRECVYRFRPYTGQAIDGPLYGKRQAPKPWDIVAPTPTYFINSEEKMQVPHTAYIKPCDTCVGKLQRNCECCKGKGKNRCIMCLGRGKSFSNNAKCETCNGTGRSRCCNCRGTGQVDCDICEKTGQLEAYVELIITWTNHEDDYISETSSMPKDLVLKVTGQVAFEEENPRVHPISHTSNNAVRNASKRFVNKHKSAFTNERILKQRHCLRLVPIGEINYKWKEKPGVFYVYGYEHKVYFKKYPQKCCCCAIL